MNIYTLHKAGSFRPPSDYDAEIENIPREKLPRPNLAVVTDENKANESTVQTSETRGSEHSSSLGEKTTPRHNVTETFTNNFANNVTQNAAQNVTQNANQNTRVSASRIDACGVITETNAQVVLPSKTAINNEVLARRKKVKATAYSSSKLRKNRHVNLIHIQAKDEFMIFEDNTDLVSHITTPSAVRTSPLENDYLVIDHEEFAEEQSLFSAITVPKALRRKRNKKKSKSKDKNDGYEGTVQEGDELKLAPSSSNDQTEKDEEEHKEEEEESPKKEPREVSVSPPKVLRTDSLDKGKSCNDSQSQNESGSGSRRSGLRGGKREERASQTEEESAHLQVSEEKDISSHERSTSSQQEDVEDEKRQESVKSEVYSEGQQEEKRKSPEKDDSKVLPSIVPKESTHKKMPSTAEVSNMDSDSYTCVSTERMEATKAETLEKVRESRKPAYVQKTKITDKARGKRRPTLGQNVETPKSTPEKAKPPQDRDTKNYGDKSPKLDGVNKYTKSAKIDSSHDAITFAAEAALYSLDVTAATTAMDSTTRTSNDGSNNDESSREESDKGVQNVSDDSPRKVKLPNSRKPVKSYAMWCLPTSYFCPHRRRKDLSEEDVRRTMSVSDGATPNLR